MIRAEGCSVKGIATPLTGVFFPGIRRLPPQAPAESGNGSV
jgi:hypothetical protein